MFNQAGRAAARLAGALALMLAAGAAEAVEPYRINVVLPLTGGAAFLGKGEQQALQILQKLANQEGGIGGAPVEFVFQDDQTSPQNSVQIVNGLMAQKPAVMIGSGIVAMCNAVAPLLKEGPFDYCLSPGIHPAAGSFQFSSSVDTRDLIETMVRYFRLSGWTKIAFISSTDASGQDAERGFDEVMKMPENASVQVVERQRFNPTDVSVAAQIERIRAAAPQAVIGWSTGAPIATVFKGVLQAGLDVPFGTTNGNMTYAQMGQYKDFLPRQLYIPVPAFPPHANLFRLDPRVEAQQQKFYAAYKEAGVKIDNMSSLAWDPGALVIDALRHVGVHGTAGQVRAYLAGLTDYAGVDGLYDFKAVPQRGLTVKNSVITRWDPGADTWTVTSALAGNLLAK